MAYHLAAVTTSSLLNLSQPPLDLSSSSLWSSCPWHPPSRPPIHPRPFHPPLVLSLSHPLSPSLTLFYPLILSLVLSHPLSSSRPPLARPLYSSASRSSASRSSSRSSSCSFAHPLNGPLDRPLIRPPPTRLPSSFLTLSLLPLSSSRPLSTALSSSLYPQKCCLLLPVEFNFLQRCLVITIPANQILKSTLEN